MTYNGSDKHKIALFNGKQDKLTAGSNIALTPLSDGTVRIDASGGGAGGDLGDLDDVVITSPTEGQSLVYDANNQEWVNGNTSGASAVSDLTDVQLTSLSDGQGLIYDATSQKWENGDLTYNVPIIYSAEEREVGVWVDGKPLYQKTITLSSSVSVPNNTWTTIYTDTFIGGIEQIVAGLHHNMGNGGAYYSCYYRPNGNNLQYDFVGNGTFNIASGTKFTIWYTKTADTAGSGTWTPDGEYAHHYSTEEKVIGTWINGDTLYEKTFSIADSSSNINTNILSSLNIKFLISGYYLIWENHVFQQMFLYYNDSTKLITNRPSNIYVLAIVVQYTKSSS